jgi:NAD(P)H dehydrogenase (quinone)
MNKTILVTGASGNMGQQVLKLLLANRHNRIIATTRNPEKIEHFREQGVDIRKADFDKPETLTKAFIGADRMLIISTDALGRPGHRVAQHTAAINAAQAVGINHVVYTSIQNPVEDSPIFVADDHRYTEAAIIESGMTWTFLRNNLYSENLIGVVQRGIESGTLISATGDGTAAYVTREDCARVAAEALASSNTENRALNITGPEALSYADIVAIVSDVTGKVISHTSIPVEDLINGMINHAGIPESMARGYATFDIGVADGWVSEVSSHVMDLTGKAPMTVKDFLLAQQDLLPVTSQSIPKS